MDDSCRGWGGGGAAGGRKLAATQMALVTSDTTGGLRPPRPVLSPRACPKHMSRASLAALFVRVKNKPPNGSGYKNGLTGYGIFDYGITQAVMAA